MAAECRHRLMDGHLASAGFIIRQYITSAHPLAHTTTRPERRTSNIQLRGCILRPQGGGLCSRFSAPSISMTIRNDEHHHHQPPEPPANIRPQVGCWRTPTSLSRHLKPRYGKYVLEAVGCNWCKQCSWSWCRHNFSIHQSKIMTICLAAVSAVTHEDHSQYQHCPACTGFIQACSLLLYPLALLSITLYIYTHQNPVPNSPTRKTRVECDC